MKKITVGLFALVLLLLSCQTTGTVSGMGTPVQETAPEGFGALVLGRPQSLSMAAVSLTLRVQDLTVVSLQNGSYTFIPVEPGTYSFLLEGVLAGTSVPLYSTNFTITFKERAVTYVELNSDSWAVKLGDKIRIGDSPGLDYSRLGKFSPQVAAISPNGVSSRAVASRPETKAPAQPQPAATSPKTQPVSTVTASPASPKAPLASQLPKASSETARPAGQETGGKGKNPPVPVPGKSALSRNVIAVVIGNRDYQRGTSAVSYALNDAGAFQNMLVTTFGIDRKDIWYNENSGLADLISLFGAPDGYKRSRVYRTASMRDSPVDLIVYYSGHGVPSTSGNTKGKGFLVPVDADLLAIQNTCYPIDTLIANIDTMKKEGVLGNSWLSFDACFSGQGGNGAMLIRNVSGLTVTPIAPRAKIKDSVLMFASSGEEFASWYPEEQHGLFTWFLLKGLSGAADENGNKVITIGEIDSYLKKWVPRFANGLNAQEQTPQLVYSDEIPGFLTLKK